MPRRRRRSRRRYSRRSRTPRGVDFHHVNGASPEKYLPETMGSGGLFFDYDNDGWLDIFLVDGGSLADPAVARAARGTACSAIAATARSRTSTARSGIRHRGYGMGACAGDYDNDGRVDLYVTNVGPNALYRNDGNGAFTDVTRAARRRLAAVEHELRVRRPRPGRRPRPVRHQLRRRRRERQPVLRQRQAADALLLPPAQLRAAAERASTATTATAPSPTSAPQSGIGAHRGNGLGVVVADYDDDGWPDVFVANDSVPNFLFHNDGRRRVHARSALRAGVAVATDGKARAGMGTDAGDYDGDGRLDLVVTNLEFEMHSLFRNLGGGLFADATPESGIGPATLPFVGFGVAFFDFDNDTRARPGDRQRPHHGQRAAVPRRRHATRSATCCSATTAAAVRRRRPQRRAGLRAREGRAAGSRPATSTTTAIWICWSPTTARRADLLRNDGGNAATRCSCAPIGTQSNRDGIGARLRLTAGGTHADARGEGGSSYLGQNDLRAALRARDAAGSIDSRCGGRADVSMSSQRPPIDAAITIVEGQGVTVRTPFIGR